MGGSLPGHVRPFCRRQSGRRVLWHCGSRGLRGTRPDKVGSCRPAGPGGVVWAGKGRSFPKWWCEGQVKGNEGDRCGDVSGEGKKTHKKYIWGK